MKKIGKWLLAAAPLLFVAGMQSAVAGSGDFDGLAGILCRIFDCHPHSPPGPHAVPEPEMIALFSVSAITAAAAAYRRWRTQR